MKISFLPGRITRFLPFILGFGIFALILWSTRLLVRHPSLGADWIYSTGLVTKIYTNTPAESTLQIGDRIISVDGLEVFESRSFPGKQIGEIILLKIERQNRIFELTLPLAAPTIEILVSRLETLWIASLFWLLGMMMIIFGRFEKTELLFFLFCQTLSSTLSFGSVSSFGPIWTAWAFRFLLLWGGPVAIQAHWHFPSTSRANQYRWFLPILYGLAAIITIVGFVDALWKTTFYRVVVLLFLGLNLLLLMVFMFQVYRSDKALDTRKKFIIALLSLLIGLLPILGLSILPEAIFSQTILPYNLSFLFLTVLPLGYGYAILGHRLIRLERAFNRVVAYIISAIFIGIAYGWVSFTIFPGAFSQKQTITWEWFVLNLILVLTAYPLYKSLLRIISHLFYGGWYDDRAAVRQFSQALDQTGGGLESIAKILCQTLKRAMQLEYVNLLLKDGHLLSSDNHITVPMQLGNSEALMACFHKNLENEIGRIRDLPAILSFDAKIRSLVFGPKPQLWLLLRVDHQILGLLILGYQLGNKPFDPADLSVLEVIVRQAKVALQNAVLLDEVRHLHYQLIRIREEERKRISRDLHDQIIQSMIGLNYRLSGLRGEVNEKTLLQLTHIRSDIRHLIYDVRQICTELRPPALDSLGLVQALEARIADLEHQGYPEIQFSLIGEREKDIPEAISLCLYRVFQEAMQNIYRHAEATLTDIHLDIFEDRICLYIRDDGKGFDAPKPLGLLAQGKHYGLVGLQELIESARGTLEICTAPGQGCSIMVTVPFSENEVPRTAAEIEESQNLGRTEI